MEWKRHRYSLREHMTIDKIFKLIRLPRTVDVKSKIMDHKIRYYDKHFIIIDIIIKTQPRLYLV